MTDPKSKLKIKNKEALKYKKHEAWLRDFSGLKEENVRYCCVLEQGTDVVENEEIGYAIVKVFFNK